MMQEWHIITWEFVNVQVAVRTEGNGKKSNRVMLIKELSFGEIEIASSVFLSFVCQPDHHFGGVKNQKNYWMDCQASQRMLYWLLVKYLAAIII